MSLAEEIEQEYQRLTQLGEYSDAAKVITFLTGKLLEISRRLDALAVRLDGLEAKLGPLLMVAEIEAGAAAVARKGK